MSIADVTQTAIGLMQKRDELSEQVASLESTLRYLSITCPVSRGLHAMTISRWQAIKADIEKLEKDLRRLGVDLSDRQE